MPEFQFLADISMISWQTFQFQLQVLAPTMESVRSTLFATVVATSVMRLGLGFAAKQCI